MAPPKTCPTAATSNEAKKETLSASVSLAALKRGRIEPADEPDQLDAVDEFDSPPCESIDGLDEEPAGGPRSQTARLSAEEAFARAALAELLDPRLLPAIRRGDPLVVLVEAPTAAWVVPLARAAGALSSRCRFVTAAKAPARGAELETPRVDRLIIAVAANLDWLSPALVDAADVRLRLRLTPGIVRRGLRLALGRTADVTQRDIAGLDLPDLLTAVRRRSSAKACVRRMRRTAERRTVVQADDNTPTLDQLKGYGAAMTEIEAIIDEARVWIAADAAGAPPPSILLHGTPGAGKTLVARSIAKTLALPVITTSVAGWFAKTEGNLGDVVKAAQTFFDQLSAAAPAIGFIDEIDGLPDRATLSDRGRDWWTPVVVGVLLMIDRVRAARPSVILIGATNHIDRLDEALKRSGRFDRHVEIRPPETAEELSDVLRHHLGDDLRGQDLTQVARFGLGGTAADAEAWVKQARQRARAASRRMTAPDLIDVIAPPDATPLELRWATALHEAAHAVVGCALGRKLLSVSIVQKGGIGGVTIFAAEPLVLSREALERQVKTALAGRAADILFSGGATTSAASDLRQATAIVTAIHASFGLGDTLLSRAPWDRAEEALALDQELRRVVAEDLDRLMEETLTLVSEHKADVRTLAEALMEQRCVTGDAAGDIVLGIGHMKHAVG